MSAQWNLTEFIPVINVDDGQYDKIRGINAGDVIVMKQKQKFEQERQTKRKNRSDQKVLRKKER